MPKLYLRLVRAFTFSFLLIFTSFISFANAGEITVNAGSDASLTLPNNSLSLNAVASSTAGSIVSYSWAVVAGPTVYQIADNSLPSTTFSNLVEGTYSLELTVTDDATNSAKDTVIVTVNTRILIDFGQTTTTSPDANGNYWNNVYAVNNGVKLSNAITTSNTRTSLGLDVFNRIDGTFGLNASGLNTQNTTAVVGDYPAEATTDYAYADQTALNAGWKITGLESSKTYTIKFWGTRAVPYDCFIEIKQSNQSTWQSYNAKDNSDFNTAAVFTFTGETEMSFDIRVQTGSPFGYISLIDITRTSASDAPNLAPIAYAGNNQYLNLPNNSTSLDGSLSNDPDGTITSYQWTKISGPTTNITNANSAVASISNLVDGIYQFELTVTDNSGNVGSSTVNVFVGSRILFDFGSSLTAAPDANGNYWNNITTGTVGVKTTDAVNTANAATGIGLEVVNRIDGTFNPAGPGVNTGNTVGVVNDYINSATTDYAFADPSATNGSWKLTGLNPNQTYSVKFWGARTIANSSRIIEIKRQDESTWQSYDAANNTNYNNAAYFTITGKTEMSFDIRVPSGSFFGYISLIDLFYTAECTPTSSIFDTTVCDIYNWNGADYTTSGTYTEQFTNAAGCDSTATLNLIVNNTPTVNAGTNQTINAGADATLAGSISGSIGGTWTGGTGTFTPNNTDLNAVYTPSAQETIDGSVTLTLEYVGTCGPVTSDVVITITPACVPTQSTTDVSACGTFNWNGTDYTESGSYSASGFTNDAGCDSTAFLNLTIIAAPDANAGTNQTIDAGTSANLDGIVTNAIGGYWSGGNGTYTPDNTDLNAVYTPSADEVNNGVVQLTLTSNQNACGLIASSQVTIFISPTAPITLLNFNGFKNGKSNKLTWTSANEVNNRGFEIQRSYNGVDFTKIGFVNSLAPGGNNTGNLNYQFADVNYLGSIQYYRLLQMDYDNHSKLSNVVVIKDGNLTTLTIDGIYPNPTIANINVLITSPNQQKSTVMIYDAAGRTVAKQTITLNSGNNIIPFDVHNFASGIYTVNLISINSNVAGKFIKK